MNENPSQHLSVTKAGKARRIGHGAPVVQRRSGSVGLDHFDVYAP
jgi:hypothetical protein